MKWWFMSTIVACHFLQGYVLCSLICPRYRKEDERANKKKKNDVFKSGINLKKIIQHSPITILPMFLAGRFFHKNETFSFLFYFTGFDGGLRVWHMGSRNVIWGRLMGETLVKFLHKQYANNDIKIRHTFRNKKKKRRVNGTG
jgi:hypothetical protein